MVHAPDVWQVTPEKVLTLHPRQRVQKKSVTCPVNLQPLSCWPQPVIVLVWLLCYLVPRPDANSDPGDDDQRQCARYATGVVQLPPEQP